ATTGRLSVGPWMVLMDEFMVSGETIVRDLQLGLRRAVELGGAMPVGYLPDMFGHIAQMPQILRLAGFEHAVVWRGVPSTVTQTAFAWEAPDGSTVRAEYLPGQPAEGLTTVGGELRSGARANVLMGVASNRVDVHQACAVAERALERRAEPLSALLVPADGYPDALLGMAWQKLVENSAHDSSCACSDDEVVDQVMVRYREARQIGDGLARE